MVRVVKAGYQVSYDKSILNDFSFVNTKINLRYLLCGPPRSDGEGIYYRIVRNDALKCIQCIAFYKTQWIPYHPHDYHPFYIYLDAAHRVKYLIIDDGHHFSKLIPIPENSRKNSVDITLFLPDHGLTNQMRKFGKIFKPRLIPLLPDQIKKWWLINNMAQLKLRTKLIDPWAPGLIPNKPSKYQSLIYRLNHLLPAKIFTFVKEDMKFTFRDEITCPICGYFDVLDFMSLTHDKSAGTYYLKKKMTCANGHAYSIRYNFDKGQIEID